MIIPKRVEALRRYDVLDTLTKPLFERMARVTAISFDIPIVLILFRLIELLRDTLFCHSERNEVSRKTDKRFLVSLGATYWRTVPP